MKNLNRNTIRAAALVIAGAALTLSSMIPARAGDFTVTTRETLNGWTTTYRDHGPAVRGQMGNDGSIELQGPAPANRCDRAGLGGFETVTALSRGERRCNGGR